ncbi:T9SS type A sorting domain-containing protein [Cytophagaceae bacterium ABcell3]|nr:T9SS type A sorting domain-containing protein [Cytophagaceae bacterium ABcell3]
MKRILLILSIISCLCSTTLAQTIDTLSNHNSDATLYAPQYLEANRWGYYFGHNSRYRQQFAEKYYINGKANVTGIVSRHAGVYTNAKNIAEYSVFDVADSRLPGRKLTGRQVFYENIDLSGTPMITNFNSAVSVADSFFVSFNLYDYAHGGYEGDTLAILCSEDGSRAPDDHWGRNAIQFHNHAITDWRDIYTQNATPVLVHLAIYPIVEFDVTSANAYVEDRGFKLYAGYPNPMTDNTFNLSLSVPEPDQVKVYFYNTEGQIVYRTELQGLPEVQNYPVLLDELTAGVYVCLVEYKTTVLSQRIVKQ